MAATITAQVIPAQAKTTLDIVFPASVTKIVVTRQDPSGYFQIIRYGDQVVLNNGHVVLDDYEMPLDVDVRYHATQALPAGSEEAWSSYINVHSADYGWLKDPAYPSMNMRVDTITSIDSQTRTSRAGVFPILDRANPIVVTAKRQGPVGEAIIHTLTDDDRLKLVDLLARGTVLLFQTPARFGWGCNYIYVSDLTEQRVGLAMEPSRRWTLPFVVVDRPEGLTVAQPGARTWQAVKNIYPTWADLANTGKSWQELLEVGP